MPSIRRPELVAFDEGQNQANVAKDGTVKVGVVFAG